MHQRIPHPIPGDENGYEAWLRYRIESDPERLAEYRAVLTQIPNQGQGPAPALAELDRAITAITGHRPKQNKFSEGVVFTSKPESELPGEAYRLSLADHTINIEASSDAGWLYGTFALIQHLQQGLPLSQVCRESRPYYGCRMLNHWDDPKFDHTLGPYNITRGFAGNSIFDWEDLTRDHQRYTDYFRMLASIGINAICINNVNADPDLIESEYLPGIQAMADRMRPYNLTLYLSVCFSAPLVTDGDIGEGEYGLEYPFNMRNRKIRHNTLKTADPFEEIVQDWWKAKVTEIYQLIPDFGGFVIKANSEGMPGPQDYGRTHADGANCIARALAPHGGTLFWRTFVYGDTLKNAEPTDPRGDGCCQPYLEFKPLDGQFDDNVILQTKNGPADFRADEPPSSLLGAVPKTRQAVEFMAAQEYLGHTTHVCYQGEHWHRILNFDTHQQGSGSTVAAVTAGRHGTYGKGACVAVANVGDDANWFGHLLAGANLYAFGKLAWQPDLDSRAIITEWTRLTFRSDEQTEETVNTILNDSYRTFARYAAPLGMGYMHESCHHYEPSIRVMHGRIWNEKGAGYDRTMKSGSQYIGQFHPEAGAVFENTESCPTYQLLFFHHLPWEHLMPDGRPLHRFIREDRTEAVEVIREWILKWKSLKGKLDDTRWAHVYERLNRQYVHAGKWRDAGLRALDDVLEPKPAPKPVNAKSE